MKAHIPRQKYNVLLIPPILIHMLFSIFCIKFKIKFKIIYYVNKSRTQAFIPYTSYMHIIYTRTRA